jgi:predicted CXXCH cytochrome family protein
MAKGTGEKLDTYPLKAPYTDRNKNYVLSCLDCHEPHGGKQELSLLRRMINGQEICVVGSVCLACHEMHGTARGKGKALTFGGPVHK